MSTLFPTSLDTFVNPSATDQVTGPGAVPHHLQHSNLNDAVAALEAKVGVDNSAVTSALTYIINNLLAWLNKANTFTASPQTINIDADTHKGIVVKAHSATQSANLQEWQNSSGDLLYSIGPDGQALYVPPSPGFGRGRGYTTLDHGTNSDQANFVTIGPNNKIIVCGFTGTDVRAARFQPNGDPDLTFGTNGVVTITAFGGGSANDAVVQSDQKIVFGGYDGSTNFALFRCHPDGTADASFGTAGFVSTPFAGSSSVGISLVQQSDGKLILGGQVLSGAQGFALARYNTDGSLDTSFGTGGRVTTDFGGGNDDQEIEWIGLQGDGKIVAVGHAGHFSGSPYAWALARYNTDGSLDTSFNTTGKILFTGFGANNALAYGGAIQADGKIIAAGLYEPSGAKNVFAVARFTTAGVIDTTYNATGMVTTDFGNGYPGIAKCALQSDGKLVVTGSAPSGSNFVWAFARYTTAGALDTTFGAASAIPGTVTFGLGTDDDEMNAVAVQTDGKIVAAGYTHTGSSNYDWAVARLNSDGTLDSLYGPRVTLAASALFQIDSTTQGLLPPRMTTTQKNAISSPAEGLYVYDNVLHAPYFWNGSAWTAFGNTYSADETTLHLSGTTFSIKAGYLATIATSGAITDATGTLLVSHGGTGLATLTAHNVMLGEGPSNVAFAAPGASSYPLVSQGASSDPAFAGTFVGNTITTDAGTNFSASATAPAVAGTSTAGATATLQASDATAGNVTSGAAAGGAVNITAGSAKRLTSGNANGGSIVATPGSGIGTGSAGAFIVREPGGTPGTQEVQITHDGNVLLIKNMQTGASGKIQLQSAQSGTCSFLWGDTSANRIQFNTANIQTNLGSFDICNGNPVSTAPDCSLYRIAANVMGCGATTGGGGGSHPTWIQNSAGEGALASNFTNATNTLNNTNLSRTVIAGRSYRVSGVLQISNSTAAEGIQFDFNGGTATATTFFLTSLSGDGANLVVGTPDSTSLAGAITYTTVTGTDYIYISGYLKCNAAGTVILRFAENSAHVSGTATLGAGSWFNLYDTLTQ